ncbi:MAG: ceramidase domain-containing protein [Alphaproteobacteria bacterium]|nr:ceramidase domain-containing protein [Alphaproteobacteria bacterium]
MLKRSVLATPPLFLSATPALAMAGMTAGSWWDPLDHYCERVAPGLLGEPLNAFTNLFFILAAGVAIVAQGDRRTRGDTGLLGVAALVASIGVGSLLFHTFANRWSLIADIAPIAIFLYAFLFVALRRFLALGPWLAGAVTMALAASSPLITTSLAPVLGASASYFPGFVITFGIAAAVRLILGKPVPWLLVAAGAAFSIALVFRTTDQELCRVWPYGSHFLWHSFNALSVGFGLFAIDRHGSKRR